MRTIHNIAELTPAEREDLTGYDLSLIECHISNWGEIYLDEYNHPMEVEDVIDMLEEW